VTTGSKNVGHVLSVGLKDAAAKHQDAAEEIQDPESRNQYDLRVTKKTIGGEKRPTGLLAPCPEQSVLWKRSHDGNEVIQKSTGGQ
jgi:hypothetical protein